MYVFISHDTINNINRVVFVTVALCIFCEVGIGYLNVNYIKFKAAAGGI
jgi:hypothetical protein